MIQVKGASVFGNNEMITTIVILSSSHRYSWILYTKYLDKEEGYSQIFVYSVIRLVTHAFT